MGEQDLQKPGRHFLHSIELQDGESLLGYLLMFMHLNAMAPYEFTNVLHLDKTSWVALATRKEHARLVAIITGLTERTVLNKQICADPFRDDRVLLDGHSVPMSEVNLIDRRRPENHFDGIYRTEWLMVTTIVDDKQQELSAVCSCLKKRRWVGSSCCELKPRSA